ncbi:MAG TPA: M13 family metallopeptidase [Vicinamibacteria bacterium]|nr:M13 family metallopeptidase [Vicinamibacteria bacterium]
MRQLWLAVPALALATGLDLAGIDRSVKPGDDFFRYANGTWLKTTEIPADRASYGPGAILAELTTQRTAAILQEAARSVAPDGSAAQRVGDYYASLVDQAAIDARGLAPLQPRLDRIGAIADRKALSRALGETLRADVDVLNATNLYTDNLLGLWVAQDLDDPARYSAFLLQGGLDMPDRAYYVDPSPRMAEIRTRFEAHVARVLELARVSDAAAKAARIVDLERRMAEAHGTREDDVDVKKGDNHWTRAQFETLAPGLDWPAYFEAAGLARESAFVVWQPRAVTGLSALVAARPLETWKDYLTFHALEHVAAVLPAPFGEERFAFHGTVLAGVPQRREAWKRATDSTSNALGEDVGRLYAERHFPPAAKARIEGMVRNLVAAFGRRIDALDWMAPATKAKAREKLAVLQVGVGYPDRWRDYTGLRVVRGDAFGNAERAERFELDRNLAKLGRPVDRSEWVMTPQTVNAVNLPAMNALNFPAAMLQPPFFDPDRPLAMDYGAIGAVIGHEVSHSFDDQGAQFDAAGRLLNWWTDADRKHFEEAAARLVRQYEAYRPFPDLHVNGTLTLSENIADVAGLAASYDAYRLSLSSGEAPVVGGLSGDQQFFLSFAQSWRDKTREPALRQQIIEDGHSPDEYRADTVRNLDEWYAAFDVRAGQSLFLAPADRVRVW